MIEITELTKSNGLLTKRINLAPDGGIISDGSACRMGRGTARRVQLDSLGAFATFIAALKSDQAIAAGALRPDLPDAVDVATQHALDELNGAVPPNLIARDGAHIAYRPGQPAPVLIDTDVKGMPPAVRAKVDALGGLWPAIVAALPALETAGRVIRRSTSTGLSDARTGRKFEGSGSLHIYLAVQDGADNGRFLEVLHARMWLAGAGWGMLGCAGQFLERSCSWSTNSLPAPSG